MLIRAKRNPLPIGKRAGEGITIHPSPSGFEQNIGLRPKPSHLSGFSFKTNDNFLALHDDRYPSGSARVGQHGFHLLGIGQDPQVIHFFPLLSISFTSCLGERSCVFSENKDFSRHNIFSFFTLFQQKDGVNLDALSATYINGNL